MDITYIYIMLLPIIYYDNVYENSLYIIIPFFWKFNSTNNYLRNAFVWIQTYVKAQELSVLFIKL